MNILYQSDNNYAPYMGVSICSLFENNKESDSIRVYIINDSIDEKNIEKIKNIAETYNREVIFLDPKELLKDRSIAETFGCTGKRWNSHSYLKILFQRMLDDNVEKILYIDSDTLVPGSVQALFDVEMNKYSIGMVQDSLTTDIKKSIGLKDADRYYNSGVILFDVNKWKDNDCERRILDHLSSVRVYGTIDQDVLNVVLKDEILTLPVKYNLQPIYLDYSVEQYNRFYRHKEPYYSDEEIRNAVKNPVILHFLRYLGQYPWHKDSIHPDRELFDYYLAKSPWKDMERKEGKNTISFKIERLIYRVMPKNMFLAIFYVYHSHMLKKGNKV